MILIAGASAALAQDTLKLSLNESLEIALDKSYDINRLKLANYRAERNLWAAKSAYRTNSSASLFSPVYNEGFKLIEVVDGNPVPKKFGDYQVKGVLDINQPMPWLPLGGGTLTFRSQAYRLDSWTPSSQDPETDLKSRRIFTSMSVRLNKPLFTINTLALNLKQAELSFERQDRVFKRSELDLVYKVTAAFYRLYSQMETHRINTDKVQRQEAIYETTLNKFKAGLIAEVEAMQAEVDLIQYRNEAKSSQGTLNEEYAAFKQLIGLDLELPVDLSVDLTLKPIVVDMDKALALAMDNRSEIIEQLINIEQQKINIKQVDARVSIKGNVSAYYDFSGFSESALPYGTSSADLLESSWTVLRDTPNRGVTFELEVPIFDWGKNKAEVQAAKASLNQDEMMLDNLKVTIVREVRNTVRRVQESFDRVQMLTKSNAVGQRSFDISMQRFANGDITSTELDRASEKLNTARLSYLQAYNQYQLALADLKRKTLYDFENNRSLVETE